MSKSSIHLTWYDPSLARDQVNVDGKFYTVRYYNFNQGQYQYMNISDHQVTIDGLQPDTDYYFEVRSMNPPYLSEWSEQARNRTAAERGRFSV